MCRVIPKVERKTFLLLPNPPPPPTLILDLLKMIKLTTKSKEIFLIDTTEIKYKLMDNCSL